MAVNLGNIWFSIQANVASLIRGARAVATFGQTAQSAANKTGMFQRSLDSLSTSSVLITGPLGGVATRFQAIAAAARKGNLALVGVIGIVATAAFGFVSLVQGMVQTRIAFQQVEKSAQAAAGSLTLATDNLAYVQRVADSTGQRFFDLAQQFTFLQAASEGTSLEGAKVRRIFSATSGAAAKLNLSVADTEGVMRALQQMMSKGTIQAEELRGQLGDRLPGAFRIMADALGVTTAKLGEMLKRGEVLAEDALPRFAEALAKAYSVDLTKPIDSIIANQNRLSNSWQQALLALDDLTSASKIWNEILQLQADFIDGLTAKVKELTRWYQLLGYAVTHTGDEMLMLGRMEDAFGSTFGVAEASQADKYLQSRIDLQRELNRLAEEYRANRFSSAFPAGDADAGRITNSELEAWLKSQKTAGEKASEGLREAANTMSLLNAEAEIYAKYSGRDLNIALRELEMMDGINRKVESFSDALRTAGVAAGTVNSMTEKYRQTLLALEQQKIIDEQTISTFEYFQDVVGNGLTTAVDNFIGALGQGKSMMETLKDTARDVVSYMLSQFIKLGIIAPLMNSLFGTASPVLGGAGIGAGFAQAVGGGLFSGGGIFGSRSSSAGSQVNMNVNLDGAVGDTQLRKTVNESVQMGVGAAAKNSGKNVVATVNQAGKRGRLRF